MLNKIESIVLWVGSKVWYAYLVLGAFVFAYAMYNSWSLNQWMGIAGYGSSLAWFLLWASEVESAKKQSKALEKAHEGWEEALYHWQETIDVLKTIQKPDDPEPAAPMPSGTRKGRTLGSR